MTSLATKPLKSCIVIGGGIAGTAITRILSERGVDVTLLEKSGQLTSGATWHAAGLVTRFAGSSKLKKIHVRSLELLTHLHETTENGIGLHLPGSIRLIEKNHEGRLYEAKQHVDMARLFDDDGFITKMIDVDEIAEKHPLVNTDNIECGIWTPSDGDIDPTSLTNCVAKIARNNGAKFLFNQNVNSIKKIENNRAFKVTTEGGEIYVADAVVNAAGLWSRGVSEMVDLAISHPAFVIEHQYAITDKMPEIEALENRLPVLRDLAGSSYIRQEGQGMLIGPYEDVCIVKKNWKQGPPSTWGMELFPDDVDRM
jgi:dimethylglycine dehydrogenase